LERPFEAEPKLVLDVHRHVLPKLSRASIASMPNTVTVT